MRNRPVLRTSLDLLAPYRKRSMLALTVLMGALVTTLVGPALVEYAINQGLVAHRSMRVIDVAGEGYLFAAAASYFLTVAQTWLISSTGEFVLNDLRKRVFAHLLIQPLAFFEAESSGQLLSRMTADIDVLETLVQNGLGTFALSLGLFVFSVIVLLITSPLMFVATAICLTPALIATKRYRASSTRAYTAVRIRIGETLAAIEEGLVGIKVVQAFRQERRIVLEFDRNNARQLGSEMSTVRLGAWFFPKLEGSGVLATVVALVLGGALHAEHLVSVGAVAAFVLYIANLFASLQALSQLFDLLQSSGAAFNTVVALLETPSVMSDPQELAALPSRGTLELRGVSFGYGEGNTVVSGVDLVVQEGEHLVLVGPSGAGKSTLAKLIGRLYDPSSGSLHLGGVDLRRASIAALRERVVVLTQEGFIFRGSVMDNILIGRPGATYFEAREAMAAIGIGERFAALPRGLDTEVGERGSRLSAGERQLISLARAALTDPAVLVMDEATSNIDPGTEITVERALGVLTEGRTTITVAHRLSTAQRADRIAVIENGNVVEVGTHSVLLRLGGTYARLFSAWHE
jgi:ATP-binding cassette subfamily B protein